MIASVEQDLLANLSSDLSSQGYEVFVQPRSQLLPSFFGSYVPDMVARREGDNIAVEVMDGDREGTGRLAELSAIFAGHPDWKLKIVGTTRSASASVLSALTSDEISDRIAETERLAEESRFGPALVYGWSALEALGRRLMPEQFGKPQTPRRLTSVLAEAGWITPTQADQLRRIAEFRNAIVHGTNAPAVTDQDTACLVTVLRDLQKDLEADTP
jgi:uncharacterized protein YutE (UPF0331/DUF86 family)